MNRGKIFYTWHDPAYREFMIGLIMLLEPRREDPNVVLINELDEHSEIIFIMKGIILLGFDINKIRHYFARFQDKYVLGAFGVTFNMRSTHIYLTRSVIEGFFLRRINWLKLLEVNKDITKTIKETILMNYIINT